MTQQAEVLPPSPKPDDLNSQIPHGEGEKQEAQAVTLGCPYCTHNSQINLFKLRVTAVDIRILQVGELV